MAKFEKKNRALLLRKEGNSIKSIADILRVSKSTASLWCRDISLTGKQKEVLERRMIEAGHKGRLLGALANKNKKTHAVAEGLSFGKRSVGSISHRELLIAGTALYWAEGSKKDNKVAFSNSDPDMILFMDKWFKEVFSLKKSDFAPRIFINENHAGRIGKVLTFWSSLLRLPSKQFGNPVLLRMKQKKVYDNHDSYFGVLSLRIRKSSVLKYNILGMIRQLKQFVGVAQR